jgi:hypothetical protein
VPIPLDLNFDKTSDYARGKTTKKYHDNSPEVLRIKAGHDLGKSLGKLTSFIYAEIQPANEQIDAMHTIVDGHENPKHKAILNEHFGEHHDIEAIKAHVNMLKTGEVKIGAIKDNLKKSTTIAVTHPKTGVIRFGTPAHSAKRPAKSTAGTLLHEASHALLQTKDHYYREEKNGPLKPISKTDLTDHKKKIPLGEHHEHFVKGCKFCISLDIISRWQASLICFQISKMVKLTHSRTMNI